MSFIVWIKLISPVARYVLCFNTTLYVFLGSIIETHPWIFLLNKRFHDDVQIFLASVNIPSLPDWKLKRMKKGCCLWSFFVATWRIFSFFILPHFSLSVPAGWSSPQPGGSIMTSWSTSPRSSSGPALRRTNRRPPPLFLPAHSPEVT